MRGKFSPLVLFLLEFLESGSECLYWVNKDDFRFCLECLRKNKKGYSSRYSKVFEKYYTLKPRNGCDKRQTLLQALKKSPFIKKIESLSTKDKKFYKFIRIEKEDLEALILDLTSKFLIETTSVREKDSNENQRGLASMMSDIGSTEKFGNVFDNSNGDDIEFPMSVALEYAKQDLNINIDEILLDVPGPEESETVPVCPDVTDPTTSEGVQSTSFYSETSSVQNLFGCNQYSPDFLDMMALEEEEVSGRIVTDSGDPQFIPSNYDPVADLIQSLPSQRSLTSDAGNTEGLLNNLPVSSDFCGTELYGITLTEHGVKQNNSGQLSDYYMIVLPSLPR